MTKKGFDMDVFLDILVHSFCWFRLKLGHNYYFGSNIDDEKGFERHNDLMLFCYFFISKTPS